MTQNESKEANKPNRGYDLRQANARNVAYFALALLVFIALSMGILALLYHSHLGGQRKEALGGGKASFEHGDQMETSIEAEWKKLDGEIALHLQGYRWVDREKGVVQVPIERAMALLAERGEAQ